MSLFYAALLGALQGLTEFFPISSSGHLVIVSSLLTQKAAPLFFDVAVHTGSLFALIVLFRDELRKIVNDFFMVIRRLEFSNESERLPFYLIVGTIPAAFIGLVFESRIEKLFSNPKLAVNMLFLTAGLLFIAERLSKTSKKDKPLTFMKAFIIGIFQAIALVPGVSRSGATMAGAMFLGSSRVSAIKFSFLLAIPSLIGATIVELIDAIFLSADWLAAGVGFVVSFIFSLFAIVFLLEFFKRHTLYSFSAYCFIVAVAGQFIVK